MRELPLKRVLRRIKLDDLISDVEEYERWVKQAENTLRSAARDKEEGDYNWCCFKAQLPRGGEEDVRGG